MQTTQSRYNSLVAAGIPTLEARYEATLEPDFAFDITANPEPDQASELYFVRMYDPATLETLDRFSTDDPYGMVDAARFTQAFDFEERMDLYAEMGL